MPQGYEIHRGKIRVYFRYDDELCREPLGIPATEQNIEYAKGLIATIKHEIKNHIFVYSRHFPNSTRLENNKLQHWMEKWLRIKSKTVSPSTIRNYRRWATGYIIPKFGKCQMDSIKSVDYQEWLFSELNHLSSKSLKEINSLVSQLYRLYRQSNRLSGDPSDGVKITLCDEDEPDTFSPDEIDTIVNAETHRPSELNAFEFACWTGCRPSELFGLCWDAIDLDAGEAEIRMAAVEGIYKATKTKRSKRRIDLLPPAIEALKRQYRITGKLKPIKISVLDRDNRKKRDIDYRPIFINESTGKPYADSDRYNSYFLFRHLEKVGVKTRGIQQCRHSFASRMLSSGVMPVDWICQQLGHSSDVMLRRRYVKYFKKERKVDPVKLANEYFDF